MGDAVDELQHRLAEITHALQGEGEEHREEQHLQDVAIGEGADHGGRDHVEQEADGALRLARLGISGDLAGVQGARIDMHASAWLRYVDHDQTDDQGDGGDDLEVQQCVTTGFTHRFHVLHARDAADHGAEDDGGNDHLDQLDETIAERLQRYTGFRVEVAEQDADGDCDQNLYVEHFVERLTDNVGRHGSSSVTTQCILPILRSPFVSMFPPSGGVYCRGA